MLRITSKGIPELQAWLENIKFSHRRIALEGVAEYLVGDEKHGLKHDPYYKYVNRYAGFPELGYTTSTGKWVPGWASLKQHQYVMAKIRSGEIKPGARVNEPTKLSEAWTYKAGGANTYVITNPQAYAGYVVGDQQTRMHSLIGWRKWRDTISANVAGAIRHAQSKINEWLRSKR